MFYMSIRKKYLLKLKKKVINGLLKVKNRKILQMTKFNTDESVNRFTNNLRKLGVDNKLRELGAHEGDTVRILDFEFEYKD